MITIDGSLGEGGGQILRTSLALSAITGQAVRIEKIRAKRPKPGLQRQHLMAVRAAARVCGAELSGDDLHSREIAFTPQRVMAGSDCGFETIAGRGRVAEDVVWAKFKSMADGARLASSRLF